jgi:hypothetical protein
MNVGELRAHLDGLPGDAMVVVRGYEGGVDEIVEVHHIDVYLNVNPEGYYGDHEPIDDAYFEDEPRYENADRASVIHLAAY